MREIRKKNYFPDIDLNLSSCVLNSKNGKRSSCMCVCLCVCVCVWGRDREPWPIFFATFVDENRLEKYGIEWNYLLMHVLVVQWVDEDDVSLWSVRSNPAYVTFLVPMKQLWMSHVWSIHLSKITLLSWAIQPTSNFLFICFFFIRKSLPLHDETRKIKSYLWFCGRVMNYIQKYWGSNLVGCVFFFWWGKARLSEDCL